MEEKAESLDSSLAELADICAQIKGLVLILFIEPGDNKEYAIYRKEQDPLSLQAGRLQGTVARYQSEKKKTKDGETKDQSALQAENDACASSWPRRRTSR